MRKILQVSTACKADRKPTAAPAKPEGVLGEADLDRVAAAGSKPGSGTDGVTGQ